MNQNPGAVCRLRNSAGCPPQTPGLIKARTRSQNTLLSGSVRLCGGHRAALFTLRCAVGGPLSAGCLDAMFLQNAGQVIRGVILKHRNLKNDIVKYNSEKKSFH